MTKIETDCDSYAAQCRRERRLRRRARKQGFELVNPWCADRRDIEGQGPYVLVPKRSGLSLDGVEAVLDQHKREQLRH